MTISCELCWNIDSRKIIWPPREHFGSENESLKGLNLFAISFFSVNIFPSTLKNSGNCVLVVVLLVTSLMTFHVFLISFVYFVSFC